MKKANSLEDLGYSKEEKKSLNYIEWNNIRLDKRISWNGETYYARRITAREPVELYPIELAMMLMELGFAEDENNVA